MNDEEQKQLAMVGQVDQLGAALKTIAPAMAQYYKALIAEAIPPDAALAIVLDWQRIAFQQRPQEG